MSVEPMQLSDQPIGKLYRGKNKCFSLSLVQEFSCSIPESMDCRKVVTVIGKSQGEESVCMQMCCRCICICI